MHRSFTQRKDNSGDALFQSREHTILQSVYRLFDEAPFALAVLKGESLMIEYINDYNLKIWGKERTEVLGKPLFEARPDFKESVEGIHAEVYKTGNRFIVNEVPVDLSLRGQIETRYFNVTIDPMRDEDQRIIGQIATSIDITEQVLARKKLEQSNRELQFAAVLAKSIVDAVIGTDMDDHIISWNKGAESIYGFKEEEAVGKHLRSLLCTVFKSKEDENNWKAVLATAGYWKGEVSHHRKDGTPVETLVSLSFITDETGKAIGAVRVNKDITEQKIVERRIKESEERFRTLAETLPQMIWIRDLEGNIEFGSKKWEEYSGISSISIAWKEMTHPDDWDIVMKVWEDAIRNGTSFRHEVRLKNKKGEYRWHQAAGEPVCDTTGKIIKWIGALTDIHDQISFAQKLEEQVAQRTKELQNSQSFLQQLIDSSIEYISVLDKDLRFMMVNKPFEEQMKVDANSLKGKHLFDFNPKAKDTIQHQSIIKAINGEIVYLDKRTSVAKPDMYIDTYFIPLRIEGKIEGVIIMARDVTSIIKAEKELKLAVNELRRSNEDLQQFAHVASHDLKEPVRKIKTFGGRIHDELRDQLGERGNLYLSKIASATDRMYAMIDGVLMYSSLNDKQQITDRVDLNQTVKDIAEDLEILIEQKGAIIIKRELPAVEGSQILLYQLFYNLINNSLKFAKATEQPEITIASGSMSTDETEKLGLPGIKKYARITLKDNGIGFNQKESEKIFQTFTRLNSKDQYEGSGLGLALCKKIVERHGGLIWAESKLNAGALFTIVLPIFS